MNFTKLRDRELRANFPWFRNFKEPKDEESTFEVGNIAPYGAHLLLSEEEDESVQHPQRIGTTPELLAIVSRTSGALMGAIYGEMLGDCVKHSRNITVVKAWVSYVKVVIQHDLRGLSVGWLANEEQVIETYGDYDELYFGLFLRRAASSFYLEFPQFNRQEPEATESHLLVPPMTECSAENVPTDRRGYNFLEVGRYLHGVQFSNLKRYDELEFFTSIVQIDLASDIARFDQCEDLWVAPNPSAWKEKVRGMTRKGHA